ncbi:MAG: glycosyl hydrolase family 18 protein [Bacillota bacterium]|jgi:hypothetical protein
MTKRVTGLASRDELRRWWTRFLERSGAAARAWAKGVRGEYHGLTYARVTRRLAREVFLNPRRRLALYVLVVASWSVFIVWGRILVPLATTPYFRPAPGFQVIGFFENPAGGLFVDSLPALGTWSGILDAVAPFWYAIGPDGALTGDGFREEVMGLARARGLRVMPLVNNLKTGEGNSLDAVRDPEARRRAVQGLADLVVARDFDGLCLSFELLPPEGRDDFTRLVQELSRALRARGRTLSVLVFPDVELPPSVSGAFDYRAIGEAADFVILRAFDRHWTLTPPGPISPLGWVEASIDSLLRHVPARKVILDIGTHAYDWPLDPAAGLVEYLPTYAALERAVSAGAEIRLDEASGQSYFDYRGAGGVQRRVWVQDARHLAERATLARRKGLRGVGVWRLGFSEDEALEELARALGRRP